MKSQIYLARLSSNQKINFLLPLEFFSVCAIYSMRCGAITLYIVEYLLLGG